MKLENEYLLLEIAESGAEVTRIYDKGMDTEILWNADPTYWKRHSPILFPNVGRTWNNTVKIDGVQYPTCQHGFARDSEFVCTETTDTRASFVLRATEETKKVYPYEFELTVIYVLRGKEVDVEWQVKNPGRQTSGNEGRMYFTIGGHPAFRFAKAGETKADYMLKFPGMEELTYILLDPASGTGVPETTYKLKLEDEMCPVTEEMFEKDALVFDHHQIEEVWFCRKDGSPYVGMRCPGFENYGIWSVKGAPFVCLEPWAGRCDNRGFDEDISHKPGINSVTAGETFSRKYTIVVA